MRDSRNITILIGAVVFVMVLSVVFVVSSRDPVVKQLAIEPVAEISPGEDLGSENTATIDLSSAEGKSASAEAAQDLVAAVPTARAGLESTNPDTVILASGEIQLVELFAFW